jgi:hypothetical protein
VRSIRVYDGEYRGMEVELDAADESCQKVARCHVAIQLEAAPHLNLTVKLAPPYSGSASTDFDKHWRPRYTITRHEGFQKNITQRKILSSSPFSGCRREAASTLQFIPSRIP